MSLLDLTAVELSKEIKAGKVTAVEAMQAVLDKINERVTAGRGGLAEMRRRQSTPARLIARHDHTVELHISGIGRVSRSFEHLIQQLRVDRTVREVAHRAPG